MADGKLTRYNTMRRAIVEAHSIDEVKDISDKAEALRRYMRQSDETLEDQNLIAEIRIRAECRLGELLKEMEKNKGAMGNPNGQGAPIVRSQDEAAQPPTLSDLGISKSRSSRAQALAELPPELRDEHIEKTKSSGKELTLIELQKKSKEHKKKKERKKTAQQPIEIISNDSAKLHNGDFREICKSFADNSIDMIFTDPPYDSESVSLYGEMAQIASRILKPGGSLLTYAGHYALPNIFELMCPHLRYWWILALEHGGNNARLPGKWVFVEWKPILWFVKDRRWNNEYVADHYKSQQPKKILHDWEQHSTEAQYYIEQLTNPGDTVLDMFCGSGTTGAAAISIGRQFVGIEIDTERYQVALRRVCGAEPA